MSYIREWLKKHALIKLVLLLSSSQLIAAPIYISAFGSNGSGPGQFDGVGGNEINPNNNQIIVADINNNRVEIFDITGNFVSSFGTFGTGDGQLIAPNHVVFDTLNNQIIVSDTGNNRVETFTDTGTYVSQFGTSGSGNAEFNNPVGVGVNSTTNQILVVDTGNERVQIFNNSNIYQSQFGSNGSGAGEFQTPIDVTVNNNRVNVTDSVNNRVQIFDASGNFISEFGASGSGAGQFNEPLGLDVNHSSGQIIVADQNNNRIQIFDSSGNFQNEFGTLGSGPGQFDAPVCPCVNSQTGLIIVSDQNNSRQVILFDPTMWNQAGNSTLVQLPLDQNLTLNNGFNLVVQNATTLSTGVLLTINSGGTFVTNSLSMDGGTLSDNASTSLSNAITLTSNDGTFNSGTNNTLTLSGNIGGAGGIIKNGAGTLVLTGNNNYAGSSTVNAGTLKVNNAITSNVILHSAAILSGHGTITGNVNSTGGIVAPGGSIGTMTINGNLNLDANSSLQIELSPTASSKEIVNGTATLNGTLDLVYDTGYYTATSYTVLSGTTVVGTFSSLTSGNTPVGIKSSFNIVGNNVIVNLINNGLASAATTPLGVVVATFMDKVGANNPTAAQQQLLGALQSITDPNALNFALTEIAPTITGALQAMEVQWAQLWQIANRSTGLRHKKYYVAGDNAVEYGFWMLPFYEGGKQRNRGSLLGYKANTTGIVLGIDKEITQQATLGIAASYAYSIVKSINFYNNYTNIKTYLGTLYGTYAFKNSVCLDWVASGGGNNYKGQRVINLPPAYAVPQADYNGQQYAVDAVLSKDIVKSKFIITPQVNSDYIYLHQNSYSETDAGSLGMHVAMKDSNVFTVGTGVKIARPYKHKKLITSIPEVHALVYYDLVSCTQNATSAFIIGGPTLATSAVPGRITAQVGASMGLYMSEHLECKVEYDFQYKSQYTNNVAYINFRYIF